MTSTTLVEATGSSHHHDNLFSMKSKVTSPLGLIQANYGKDGPNLSLQQKGILGGSITAASPKLDSFDFVYNKEHALHEGRGMVSATLGLNAPMTSMFSPLTFVPRAILKYGYGKGVSATITSKLNKKYEPEVTSDLVLSKRFEFSEGIKGMVKADIKQTLYAQDKPVDYPSATFSARLMEKAREYGVSYASKKNKLSFFNASYLPTELRMHRFINAIVPTAIGMKVDIPVEKFNSPKRWTRTALASFALGNERTKESPTALNVMLSDSTDLSATLLRRDALKMGETDMTVIYSMSAKANIQNELGIGKESPKGPVYGVKFDVVGDVAEFPLAETFNLW